MLINEIAAKCNTTKKAVQYYVAEGLLVPNILENGYKDYSEQDMKVLKQIVLYRKLGLSINEIKCVLKNHNEITRVLYQRTLELEREKVRQKTLKKIEAGEELENIEEEINDISSNSIIKKRLLDLFPGYFGKFISLNFSGYLQGEIETEEQMKAFQKIVDFFDNVPDIYLPEDLRQYLDEYAMIYESEEGTEIISQIIQKKADAIENIDAFMDDNKEFMDKYMEMKQTKEFKESPAFRFMEYMKIFCESSGYYDIFIPAMRKLSPLYDAYYEQMLKANDKFMKNYPEYLEK